MSPVLSLVLLPFEASKVQDYRLAPVPRNSDYNSNPQGFAVIFFSIFERKFNLPHPIQAIFQEAQTNLY